MSLNNLSPQIGAKKVAKRKGRGQGSNLGKTAGRGQKGAGSRKSSGIRAGFEGGQQPLQRRVPKRGFKSPSSLEFQIVNLMFLEKKCSGDVSPETLVKLGAIRHVDKPVKILGMGNLTKKLQVRAHAFSAKAKEAIEKANGVAEVI